MYYESDNYLAHYGVKGMKWGVRRTQEKAGSALHKTKTNASSALKSQDAEKVFNTIKKGANAYLDKKDRDNFFESDDIFSEESMKRQSRIDNTRRLLNDMDYKTLTSSQGGKHLKDLGKTFVENSLDDADDRDFFNQDWDTRMNNQENRDIVRSMLRDL